MSDRSCDIGSADSRILIGEMGYMPLDTLTPQSSDTCGFEAVARAEPVTVL